MLRLCKFRKFILSKKIPRSLTVLRSALATTSPVTEDRDIYKEGDQIHGYTVKQVSEISEFHATGILLEHDVTGAEHLHLARDDQNNVFSVAFRTTPMDSTGVSHILEHTVLCGSEKFPCRDPFFKMLNRSLSTFMNAFTASDWTMYPFSTQNEKDFANLMSVYLDSVFFPLLNELDFCQEGWRLEQSDLKNPSSDIIFKGVVFNEMKGALSNAESLYATHHQCLLLPHHTYGYNSGGDPLCIPQLTYEQLKEFHRSHYHPSNAKFYTYGDFPLENHLKTINDNIMKKFQKINPGTEIPTEPKWKEPKWVEIDCPPDRLAPDPDKQTIVSVSYLLDYIEDPFEAFTIGILSALLVDGPNSPFYQALIEPNIGSDYSPVVGVDSHTKNPSFAVGLQGIHPDDVDKVVNIIKETFQNVVKNGFDPMRIESILHRIELALKHQTSNFGLNMIIAVIYSWNQDKNPLDSFSLNKQVKRFRETIEQDPEFLQKKVQELFLNNTHELTLIMKPKETYAEEKDRKENELLQEKISLLSDEDKKDIYEKAIKLEELQNEKDDASFLPKMQISDIDKNIKTYDVEKDYLDDVEVYKMKQPTNGITYFRAITTTSSIPYTLRPYLPLFSNVITNMAAPRLLYRSKINDKASFGIHPLKLFLVEVN